MKFVHLSDLHIGKRVNEFSMIEDQKYILEQIIQIIEKENAESVMIAGDIYDKPVPSAEAVRLFDHFLTELADRNLSVFIISGNHDSAERISFGKQLMSSRKVYVSSVFSGNIDPVILKDKYGELAVYLMPFIKPAYVRHIYQDETVDTYQDAVKCVVDHMETDKQRRNIIVSHQFVTGAKRCESEEVSVGGLDNIDVSVYEKFDYTALGHIHSPQNIKKETVRYCGTPLKYSFSECRQDKTVTVVNMKEKGNTEIYTVPLVPLRDMKELKGRYEELTSLAFYKDKNTTDYFHITLTDEYDIVDALAKLRIIYPNIMKMDYDNTRTKKNQEIREIENITKKSPAELFNEFYEIQNNRKMNEEQKNIVNKLIEKIWEA